MRMRCPEHAGRAWQEQPDTMLWADFSGNDPGTELHMLAARSGLHPLAMPRATAYPNRE